ncbi:hypothetical protein [Georgenia muralis]|uniref:Uncharacterized protein n=1 Tax=Georgenia muralis TaxID=154117 RepID=A0A3N4ZLL0_9MICO|nr:hypothetical protein [Georgenia muralis]RPF26582.1 hypothetical protein EDD32_1029 [Georgenia muralis]
MQAERESDHSALACLHLRSLLATSPAYRAQWQVYVRRDSRQDIHQGAVAQVLAQYLWETGEAPETETDLPRRLKDRVGRALNGSLIAPATLRLFIEAFDMSRADANQLWALFMHAGSDDLAVLRATLDTGEPVLPPPTAHEALAVHEFHRMGSDRMPVEHRTLQVIRALEPMDRYLYQFDTNAAVVEVVRGGTAGPVRRSPFPGIYGVQVHLSRPLAPGETASIEYRTILSYTSAPPPEFRRGVLTRLRNLEMNLQFHPDALPARVWWGHWESVQAPAPSTLEEVTLTPDHDVHRYVPLLEHSVVGFTWEWD